MQWCVSNLPWITPSGFNMGMILKTNLSLSTCALGWLLVRWRRRPLITQLELDSPGCTRDETTTYFLLSLPASTSPTESLRPCHHQYYRWRTCVQLTTHKIMVIILGSWYSNQRAAIATESSTERLAMIKQVLILNISFYLIQIGLEQQEGKR